MSSLCIKTNNEDILTYLQNEFSDFNMLNVFYSKHEFNSVKKDNSNDPIIPKRTIHF